MVYASICEINTKRPLLSKNMFKELVNSAQIVLIHLSTLCLFLLRISGQRGFGA